MSSGWGGRLGSRTSQEPAPVPGARRAGGRGSPSAPQPWPGSEISTPTPSSLPGGVFRGSLRSLRLASPVAAEGRAQPGRALLPALLPRPLRPPPSLLLLLFLRLLPRFLSALLYLSGTFSDYLSYSRCLPAPPSSGPRPTPREDKLAKGRAVPGEGPAPVAEAPTEGHRGGGGRAGGIFNQGQQLELQGRVAPPDAAAPEGTPGRWGAAARPPAAPSPAPAPWVPPPPLLRAATAVLTHRPAGSSARRRDFLGLRQLLGGGAGRGRRRADPCRTLGKRQPHPARPAPQPGSRPRPTPRPHSPGALGSKAPGIWARCGKPVPQAGVCWVTLGESLSPSALASPFAQRMGRRWAFVGAHLSRALRAVLNWETA